MENIFGEQKQVDEIQYDEAGDKIIKGRQLTLQEKMEIQKAKKLHRENITKQQIVKGKVFKGISFICKPEIISFKDFTVGQTHTLVVQLTNVSNAFNSFNLIPLDQNIRVNFKQFKNYFQIQYVPQGKISPGLSCSITIKFTPLANEDIEGYFCILAETGKIQYPIICTSKKSIVNCSQPYIQFNDVIFGQKSIKQLVLFNSGSLPTQFSFKSLSKKQQGFESVLKYSKEGIVQGNSQCKITFEVFPNSISRVEQKIQLNFNNFKYSPPIIINISWSCIELPIYIQKQLFDCQLVLAKHIYRRKLVFKNRSKNTMKINIHQPSDTKDFFEFNPLLGYIQGQSDFEIWMKITLEKNPEIYLKRYCKGQDLYEFQFKITASDQIMPVPFKVRFKLTSDIVKITPQIIDFNDIFQGYASRQIVTFQNTGQLLQQIQLFPIPKQFKIDQNRTNFKILPKEQVSIQIIFQPDPLTGTRSRKDDGQLCFKVISGTLSTQQRRIKYEAMIVKKQLDVSKSKLQFPAIQVDEKYSNSLQIKNITNKDMDYEIILPPYILSGIQIMPLVGNLKSGQSSQLFINYLSKHRELTYDIFEQINKPIALIKQQLEIIPQTSKKQAKKQTKKEPKLTKQQLQQLELQKKQKEEEQRIQLEKQRQQRQLKLKSFDGTSQLQKYGARFIKFQGVYIYNWIIPIYYKFNGASNQSSKTTFIEIITTSVDKKIKIQSVVLDFQHVVVGTRKTKSVFISSSIEQQQQLYKNQLSVFSGFSVVNALRTISQNKKFNLVIQFTPYEEQPFRQILTLKTTIGSISCELKGRGIRPQILLIPDNGILNFGGLIVDQFMQKSFKLKNLTQFKINFNLNIVRKGILNKYNTPAFTYIPKQGMIQGNQQIQIKVKFKPNRISDRFYNLIDIQIPEQKNPKRIIISGYSYPRQAYINLYKPSKLYQPKQLPERIQYVYDSLDVADNDKVLSQNNNKLLLIFKKVQKGKQQEDNFKQRIVIGSCKVLDPKLQKPTNFQVIMPKDDRFTVDIAKGTATPGNQTVVTFTYKPPQADKFIQNIDVLQDIGQWKDIKVDVKVSGGYFKVGTPDVMIYQVTLRAYINQI